jgi:hypothetical protein
MQTEREPFAGLVELGAAVGELGAALSQAHWRMEEAALELAAEAAEKYRQALPEGSSPEAAAALAGRRVAFYAMPRVEVRLESALRVTRTGGGLVRMLLGGARSTTQESAASVDVTLVAVPVGEALEELLAGRARTLQRALVEYLAARGLSGPDAAEALRRYDLAEDAVQAAEPGGSWARPPWPANLLAFKRVWNRETQVSPEETAFLLPETPAPDRLTLSVLGALAERLAPEAAPAPLEAEARILLAALSGDNAVHDARAYPRGEWNTRWGELHARVLRELGLPEAGSEPSAASLARLRAAWASGRKRLRP